jgi:hypothetical protein
VIDGALEELGREKRILGIEKLAAELLAEILFGRSGALVGQELFRDVVALVGGEEKRFQASLFECHSR